VPKKSPKPETRGQKSEVSRAKKTPFYKSPPPKGRDASPRCPPDKGRAGSPSQPQGPRAVSPTSNFELPSAKFIAPSHFTLREDGSVVPTREDGSQSSEIRSQKSEISAPTSDAPSPTSDLRLLTSALPRLVYHDDARKIWLYHGNSLELLDAIAAKYPEGRFAEASADGWGQPSLPTTSRISAR